MKAQEYRNIVLKKSNKFNAKKCSVDGRNFESLMERDYYLALKANPDVQHIDDHIRVTMPDGNKLSIDFIVYMKNIDKPRAIEIKGKQTQDFRRARKSFDYWHPLAPLEVYTRKCGRWESL